MKQTAQTKKYYDQKASLWSSRKTNSFHHQKQFEFFVSQLPERARILDIGCASGIHVPLFLGIGRHLKYHGIDISNSFLKIARSRYPQLTFEQANVLDRTSLPQKKFGGFWAGAVLMHIPLEDWPTMFKNIESIMKPGAIGYITLPVAHPSGPNVKDDPRHFTLLNVHEQKAQLRARSWDILKSGTLDGTSTKAVWRWYVVQLPE